MNQHGQHPDASAQAFATRAIHAGQTPDLSIGTVMPSIHANSTYIQESSGVHKGLDYGYSHNPIRWALECCMADLEGDAWALAFVSGLATISSVLELFDAGSHVVFRDDLYGDTFRLLKRVHRRSTGHHFSFADPTDPQAFRAASTPETRMVQVETPSNPLLHLTDLCVIAQLCHTRGIISVADDTFTNPYIQCPLELGFGVVVHSITKYPNGHSDVIGDIAVVGDNLDLRECLGFLQSSVGTISEPFNAFLTLCGVKALALRMERHCSNALALAQWLECQPQVAQAYYPDLASHPQRGLTKWQMHSFGGMISLDLRCDLAGVRCFLKDVRIFSLAESLGGAEGLIEYPVIMIHANISAETRADLDIGDSLIHLSVGVEALEDLQVDLVQVLAEI